MNAATPMTRSQESFGRPIFWLATFVVFTAFFATDHDLTISKADAFTSTAEEMEQQAEGGNWERRLAFLGMAGLGMIGFLIPGRNRVGTMTPTLVCIGLFFGWCATSILWSADPSMTIRRSMVLGCLLIAALGISRQLTMRELLHAAWIIPLAGLVIGFGAELALGTFRPWSGNYRFSGTLHPNTQGLSLAALCLSTFCIARESDWKKQGYLVLFGIAFVFLLITKSRTSLAGVLLAVTLILTLRTRSEWKWSVGLGALWCVTAAALFVMLFNIDVQDQLTQMALLGRKEQAESLTGRLPIWTVLSDYVVHRPILGYGYDSFWTPDRIETVSHEIQWGLKEAHNAYLDCVLSVGLIGLCLVLVGVFHMLRRAYVQYLQTGHPLCGFLFGMIVFGLINACTESGMFMPMFVPFLLICSSVQISVAVLEERHGLIRPVERVHPSSLRESPILIISTK